MGVTAPGLDGAAPRRAHLPDFPRCSSSFPAHSDEGAKTRLPRPEHLLPPHLSSRGCADLCQGPGTFLLRRTKPPAPARAAANAARPPRGCAAAWRRRPGRSCLRSRRQAQGVWSWLSGEDKRRQRRDENAN